MEKHLTTRQTGKVFIMVLEDVVEVAMKEGHRLVRLYFFEVNHVERSGSFMPSYVAKLWTSVEQRFFTTRICLLLQVTWLLSSVWCELINVTDLRQTRYVGLWNRRAYAKHLDGSEILIFCCVW